MTIKDFLKKYGKQKKIKKGDYLYKANDKDTNLYYILGGKVLLSFNGENIALIGENEINGEKSFLENTAKPIDAIAKQDTDILCISIKDFNSIEETEKINFLKSLTLGVSNRVYLLNDIITNLALINEQILEGKVDLSLDYLKKIFSFVDLRNIYIYKNLDENNIIPIFETKYDLSLQDKVREFMDDNLEVINIDSSIILKLKEYLIVLEGKKLKSDYIVNNILVHSSGTLKYLCYLLEDKKNNDLSTFLD